MPARKPMWQLRSHWNEIGWSMQDGCHTTSTFAHKSWKSNIPTIFLLGGTTSGLYHPMSVGMFHLERLPPYSLACFPHKCVHYSLSQFLGNPSSTSRYVFYSKRDHSPVLLWFPQSRMRSALWSTWLKHFITLSRSVVQGLLLFCIRLPPRYVQHKSYFIFLDIRLLHIYVIRIEEQR